jgi:hypothetical protein
MLLKPCAWHVLMAARYSADERRKLTILDFRFSTGIFWLLVNDLSCVFEKMCLDGPDVMFVDVKRNGSLQQVN